MDTTKIQYILAIVQSGSFLIDRLYSIFKDDELDTQDTQRVISLINLGITTFSKIYEEIERLKDKEEFTEDERNEIDRRVAELKSKFEAL